MCVTSLLQALAVGCACGSVLIFCICIGQYATETFEQLVLDLPNDTCNAVAGLNFTSTLAPVTLEVTSFTDETSAPETSDFLNWFFSISYLWYRTIGVTVIILVGSILSLVAGARVCKPRITAFIRVDHASYCLVAGVRKTSDVPRRFLCACFASSAGPDDDGEETDETAQSMMLKVSEFLAFFSLSYTVVRQRQNIRTPYKIKSAQW